MRQKNSTTMALKVVGLLSSYVLPMNASCPPDWMSAPAGAAWRNRCYFSTEKSPSLKRCLELCSPHGAPACIESAEEQAFITENIPAPVQEVMTRTSAYRVPGHWIGLLVPSYGSTRPLTSRSYTSCVSGSTSSYTNWALGQPVDSLSGIAYPNHVGNSDCVMLSDGFDVLEHTFSEPRKWKATSCDYYGYFERMPCLCASPGGVNTSDARIMLEVWTTKDRARIGRALTTVWVTTIGPAMLFPVWIVLLYHIVLPKVLRLCRKQTAAKATPVYGATMDIATQADTLNKAVRAASQRRFRVNALLITLGFWLILVGFVPILVIPTYNGMVSVQPDPLIGPFNMWLALPFGPGLGLILMVVQPTDVTGVRTVSYVIFMFMIWNAYSMSGSVAGGIRHNDSLTIYVYGFAEAAVVCAVFYLLPALLCSRCASERHVLAPRAALRRVWVAFRVYNFVFPLTILIYPFAILPYNPEVFSESPISPACLGAFVLQGGIGLLASPRNRGRVHHFLQRLVSGAKMSSENEAALVAALVGGGSAETALTAGASRFRALAVNVLTEDDLRSSTDSGLFTKTERATLGSVHGFLSHSWSDDGTAKFVQIYKWALEARERSADPVLVWLDKACIDQADISANLAALPVFLSGCRELVVLAGRTYASRLWCCIELFTFAKMGGAKDQVKFYELEAECLAALERFDAGKATCFLPQDRERLLAVLEAGYGSFEPFNKLVRGFVAAKTKAGDVPESGSKRVDGSAKYKVAPEP